MELQTQWSKGKNDHSGTFSMHLCTSLSGLYMLLPPNEAPNHSCRRRLDLPSCNGCRETDDRTRKKGATSTSLLYPIRCGAMRMGCARAVRTRSPDLQPAQVTPDWKWIRGEMDKKRREEGGRRDWIRQKQGVGDK